MYTRHALIGSFFNKSRNDSLLFLQTLAPRFLSHNYNLLTLKGAIYWHGAVTSNQSMTFELMSLALEYSHLGGLVLTQRLLVQLIAICIALLVSQHCLRDISIFFPFSLLLCLSQGSVLFLAFWGEELDSVWCVIKYSCLK